MLYTKEELHMRSYSELRRMASILKVDIAAFGQKDRLIEEIIRKTNENLGVIEEHISEDESCSKETTQEGKGIFKKEHPDGRKDVEITVKTIDVEVNDEATAKSKDVIEKVVFDKLSKQIVTVVVIHKPTNECGAFKSPLNLVRKRAMEVVQQHNNSIIERNGGAGGDVKDYCIVEFNDGEVTVSTL